MSQPDCSICQNTRHVLTEKGWVRCSCSLEREMMLKYSLAGITYKTAELLLELSVINKMFPSENVSADALEILEATSKNLKNKVLSRKIWCFQGTPLSPKDFMLQCILKDAVDSGFKVKHVNMTDLITSYFKHEADFSLISEFLKYDLFVVSFGTEIQAKVSSSFLNELARVHHSNLGSNCLLLHTTLNKTAIENKYSGEVASLFSRYSKEDKNSSDTTKIIYLSVS